MLGLLIHGNANFQCGLTTASKPLVQAHYRRSQTLSLLMLVLFTEGEEKTFCGQK